MSEALKHVNRTITPILTKNSTSSETSMHLLLQLKVHLFLSFTIV